MNDINDENLSSKIKEAGESIFKNIYKSVQSEIKDQIITKLLHKIEIITKELESLKLENQNLKNHLTYILKRILLNKNYFNKTSNNINEHRKSFIGYKTCNDIFKHTKNNDSLSICSTKRNVLDRSFSNDTKSNNNTHRDKTIDIKVTGKLNSIYRNNFLRCSKGRSNDFILTKDDTIYDELFPINKKLNSNTTRNSTNRERNKEKNDTNNKNTLNYSYMTKNKANKTNYMKCKLGKISNCKTHNNSKTKIINVKRKTKIEYEKTVSRLSSNISNDPLDFYKKNVTLTMGNEENVKKSHHASLLRGENLAPVKKKPKKILISNNKSPFLINKI